MAQCLSELNIPHEMFWWQIQTKMSKKELERKEWTPFVHGQYKTKIFSRDSFFINIYTYTVEDGWWSAITVAHDEKPMMERILFSVEFNCIDIKCRKGGRGMKFYRINEDNFEFVVDMTFI